MNKMNKKKIMKKALFGIVLLYLIVISNNVSALKGNIINETIFIHGRECFYYPFTVKHDSAKMTISVAVTNVNGNQLECMHGIDIAIVTSEVFEANFSLWLSIYVDLILDVYFNASVDTQGDYEKTLPYGKYYVILRNRDMSCSKRVDFKLGGPQKGNIVLIIFLILGWSFALICVLRKKQLCGY